MMTKKMYTMLATAMLVLIALALALSACGGNADADPYNQEQDYSQNPSGENGDDDNQQEHDSTIVTPPRVEPPIIDWRILRLSSTFVPDPDDDFQREWMNDIRQLRRHVLWNHPYFANPALFNLPKSIETGLAFDELLNALIYQLPYLSEFEVLAEIERANALFGTSSFGFWAFGQAIDDWFPFTTRWLDDGLYVLSSCVTLRHMLNHRIVGINGIPLDEVLDAAMPLLVGANDAQRRSRFAFFARSPMFMQVIGLGDGQQITYNLVSTAGTAVDLHLRADQMPPGVAWTSLHANNATPPLHQTRDADIWHEYLEEYGILYFRFVTPSPSLLNQNPGVSPIPDANTIHRIITTYELNAIVVDMRNPNASGDILRASVRTMFNNFGLHAPEGRLFVLIDENIGFYTGVESALHLESLGAILIGQQSQHPLTAFEADWRGVAPGGSPDWMATLYHSDATISVLTRPISMNLSGTTREFPDNVLTPHIHINAMTIDDWYHSRDLWMDIVLEQIGR